MSPMLTQVYQAVDCFSPAICLGLSGALYARPTRGWLHPTRSAGAPQTAELRPKAGQTFNQGIQP
jgi:hypothetical protein